MSAVMSRPLADYTSTDLRSIDELDAAICSLAKQMNIDCYGSKTSSTTTSADSQTRHVTDIAPRQCIAKRNERKCAKPPPFIA